MESTFKGNIHEHKDLTERERESCWYEITYFTEDVSERVDNNSSAGKNHSSICGPHYYYV